MWKEFKGQLIRLVKDLREPTYEELIIDPNLKVLEKSEDRMTFQDVEMIRT